MVFSWLFRAGPWHRSHASSSSTRLLVYARCHHVGVSPGEDTDSEWGLAPKKNSSEECGLAEKDLVLEVSSEDWVECEWSQLSLARWGGSSVSSLTGYVLLGGLATVGFGGFFVALISLEKQCLGLFRGFFVVFSWLFRGPHFGQNLRVLTLEKSSDLPYFEGCCVILSCRGPSLSEIFVTLVFRISLVNFKQGISLVILVFSLSFPRILWVRQ